MREGRPLVAGAEVVRLERRTDAPGLFDVRVECAVPAGNGSNSNSPTPPQHGPAQVATREYRENWELTFGTRNSALN